MGSQAYTDGPDMAPSAAPAAVQGGLSSASLLSCRSMPVPGSNVQSHILSCVAAPCLVRDQCQVANLPLTPAVVTDVQARPLS